MRPKELRERLRWQLAVARVASSLALAVGCTPEPAETSRVQFGIFYGGQIQERTEIPFELNRAVQQQGFALVFSRPLSRPANLNWELSRPGPVPKTGVPLAEASARVTELGSATLLEGQSRFEHPLTFRPGDPLGLWNIRVVVDDRVLLDRPFTVYDKDARRRARSAARVPDAGL
jgi:hypothetical protein